MLYLQIEREKLQERRRYQKICDSQNKSDHKTFAIDIKTKVLIYHQIQSALKSLSLLSCLNLLLNLSNRHILTLITLIIYNL